MAKNQRKSPHFEKLINLQFTAFHWIFRYSIWTILKMRLIKKISIWATLLTFLPTYSIYGCFQGTGFDLNQFQQIRLYKGQPWRWKYTHSTSHFKTEKEIQIPNTQHALKETPLTSFEKQTHKHNKIRNNILKNSFKFKKRTCQQNEYLSSTWSLKVFRLVL